MLRSLPSLKALDLSEQYDAVTDEAGPILAALPSLEALNLALTNVGDLLLDALTYSRRLAAWAHDTGKDVPPLHRSRSPHCMRIGQLIADLSGLQFNHIQGYLQIYAGIPPHRLSRLRCL